VQLTYADGTESAVQTFRRCSRRCGRSRGE
jgi:hypothetical protein